MGFEISESLACNVSASYLFSGNLRSESKFIFDGRLVFIQQPARMDLGSLLQGDLRAPSMMIMGAEQGHLRPLQASGAS